MGTMPWRAITRTSATPSRAPPKAPADTSTQGLILSTLLRRQRCRGAKDIAGTLPVGAALRQLAPRAGGEDHGLFHVADIVPEFGGGKVGHRLILERAVGLGGLVPGEGIIVLHQ